MALAVAGDAINALLLADAPTVALVGTRIFPDEMPQGEVLPAVVYTEEDCTKVRYLGGVSGTAHPRYQIECLARTRKECRALAAVVRTRLEDYHGAAIGGVWVQWIVIEAEDEGLATIQNTDGSARLVKRKTFDVVIWHNTTPES